MSEFVFILTAFVVFIVVMLIVYNTRYVITHYTLNSKKLSKPLRIVVVSDLHNKKYGKGNLHIVQKIKSLNPDIIAITGDFVDRRRPDFAFAKSMLDDLKEICDVYYITGNHESALDTQNVISELCSEDVMLNEQYKIYKEYSLLGFSDRFDEVCGRDDILSVFEQLGNYKIVFTHRQTDFFENLCLRDHDVDLILCGHTHGGEFRMPFFGAVYLPDEGFFPRYSKGLYVENNTSMIVSGGLGNTFLPLRVNNFPEIVCVDIKSEQKK